MIKMLFLDIIITFILLGNLIEQVNYIKRKRER